MQRKDKNFIPFAYLQFIHVVRRVSYFAIRNFNTMITHFYLARRLLSPGGKQQHYFISRSLLLVPDRPPRALALQHLRRIFRTIASEDINMTTPRSESKRNVTEKTPAKSPADAIALLKADHRKVEELFSEFEAATRADRKGRIAAQICEELTVHAAVEEQGFYPPARAALGEDADLIAEASVEHASLKWLIAQIENEVPSDDLYDAKVKVLKEYVAHHVKEEESEIFPKLKKTDLDLVDLGQELQGLKQKFQKELTAH